MEKKIMIVGDLGVGGERGRIVFGGGIATSITATEYKDPQKVIKTYGNNHSWCDRQYSAPKQR